ncbi:hypothetical protein RISK_002143 [Rhodopirellula islandica]|uniref:Uncharacterized protein n=1 Tax=Rhodopirellula islandica TaxID=595434 RepID=A0A0J1BG60_RHOIS|nr:hypothetical protein RISK_002143 [Rhodopirellula islandica]
MEIGGGVFNLGPMNVAFIGRLAKWQSQITCYGGQSHTGIFSCR